MAVGKGKTRSYPYKDNVELRNHEDHLEDAQKALNSKSVCLLSFIHFYLTKFTGDKWC